MPAKNKGRGRAPKNQHQLCAPLPEGEVLTDLKRKTWTIGKALGKGGFGLIYTADEGSKSTVKANAAFVIKVEPHGNGPLYSEIAFYQRVAKPELIEEWRKRKKMSYVPVPQYTAHGLHDHNGASLRFLVMPRFGTDLHKLWIDAGKRFKRGTVAKIAIKMLDGLEYMHSKEYVHADIKGANILCGHRNSKQLFLVDYGLAYRYIVENEHKTYKADPKKAHNGTIEYTSTDAHDGAYPSRRGDIEILGFFLLHLLSGSLPWEGNLTDCNYVRDSKKQHLKRPDSFVKNQCGTSIPEISKLLEHSTKLRYDEEPNYNRLRDLFKSALKTMSVSLNSSLDFSSADGNSFSDDVSPRKQRSKPQKRKIVSSHPSKNKSRKKASMLSSDDDDDIATSSLGSDSTPMPSAGLQRVRQTDAASSSTFEESSPVMIKTRNRQQRAQIIESDSDDNTASEDISMEDFSSPAQVKQKAKATRKGRPRKLQHVSNSKNDEPKVMKGLLIPKQTKPPVSAKPRTSPRKKATPVKTASSVKKTSPPLTVDNCCVKSIESYSDSDFSEEAPSGKSSRRSKQTSRYSMTSLHTDPVLTKTDQLTGKFRGKHPVFVRRRKKNVLKTDASTQTTPKLSRTASKK